MRLRPHRVTPHVEHRPKEVGASVHVLLAGLRFAMSPSEALALADRLVDAAETPNRNTTP